MDGRLRLKAYPRIELINSRTGAPLALGTLAGRTGGGSAIQDELGFTDWQRRGRQQLPSKAIAVLQAAGDELGAVAAAVDSLELQDLGQIMKEASDAVHKTFTDEEIDGFLATHDDPPLNPRELRGLDKAMQTIRGELTNNLAKLSELNDHIATEKGKLTETQESEAIDEFTRRRIADCLHNLEDERASQQRRLQQTGRPFAPR